MSTNFASDVKPLVSNLLENKSDLNKVKASLLYEEKSKKDFFFLDDAQLDNGTVPMLWQTLAYKSQCMFKYIFRWKIFSFEREFSNPV